MLTQLCNVNILSAIYRALWTGTYVIFTLKDNLQLLKLYTIFKNNFSKYSGATL